VFQNKILGRIFGPREKHEVSDLRDCDVIVTGHRVHINI
jgi:rRNA processing protein Krr1/Pno1